MKSNKLEIFRILPVVLLAATLLTGCEHESREDVLSRLDAPDGGGGKTPSSAKNFIGRWKLDSNTDPTIWYAFFDKDGSWRVCNNPDGSVQRAYGSYSVSDNGRLNGNMINPGTGSGAIYANIDSAGTMTFDFEEHWHTPYKTLRFIGVRH